MEKVKNSNRQSSEDEDDRGKWDNQCDFFLSCMGYAVGLGNVWRFPYLCYKHGGGTFLVAYGIMLALIGLPLFFLELSIGQYSGLGPTRIFGKLAPAFKGLGYGMLFVTLLVAIYYNMIIGWTLYYMFAGFTSTLPWTYCGQPYNAITCYQSEQAEDCNSGGDGLTSYWNNSCTEVSEICQYYNLTHLEDEMDEFNFTMCSNGSASVPLIKVYNRTTASEDYYTRIVLGLSDNTTWNNYGGIKWDLALCLLAAWAIVGLSLIKGVQSSGKVVYFTALFPYFVLLCLLVRGAMLPGAVQGINFYLQPKLESLLNIHVWSDAATQIFYSLGPAFGGLITLASYNKFSNNCHRDAILIAICNFATSIFAGFVVFSIIGFMAHESGQAVGDVIASGPGLAFVAYPEAVTKFSCPPVWSFLFFLMLLSLGLDTQFTMTETLTTAVMDQWPELRKRKAWVVSGSALIGFILGLPMCCNGGVYMFTLIDTFSASWSLLLMAFFEVVLLIYVYGFHNFMANVSEMSIRVPKILRYYWQINWHFCTPVLLFLITIITWVMFEPCKYQGYEFPPLVQALGWLIATTSVMIAVGMGGFESLRLRQSGKITTWKTLFRTTDKWGPAKHIPISEEDLDVARGYDNPSYN